MSDVTEAEAFEEVPIGPPVRISIYKFAPETPLEEVRWSALTETGHAVYDSGDTREGYSEKEEKVLMKDIKAKYPDLPVSDERV